MHNKTEELLDFVAIGVGPFNLGLACLSAPIKELNGVFLDKRKTFNWHSGMLLQDTTLQVPFLADLVTLADPTSSFSFLNYIKEQGRIYSFYIKENFLLLRNEYNQYCKWAINKLSNVYFNTEVTAILYNDTAHIYTVTSKCKLTNTEKIYHCKKLVLGTGTQPYIPKCTGHLKENIIHSSQYLNHKEVLQAKNKITVIGSGQSAAEIVYDLLQDIENKRYELSWITRSPRFFPLEYSKLTLEMTSPEYIDYFYNLPSDKRDTIISKQKHLYKGINQDLIAAIFDCIYTKKVTNTVKINLRTNSELQEADYDTPLDTFNLQFHQHEQDKYYRHSANGLVLATGYTYRQPNFIKDISHRITWDDKHRFNVNRNYTIDVNAGEIFVQNAELHTHGFVTPDLGMGAYRNSSIINTITGKEHYTLEKRIAFQQFEVSEDELVTKEVYL